jgi:hypothetical protein
MSRSKRSLMVEALDALIKSRMAAVFIARDWELLEEIAHLVETDAPLDWAASDPAMFATLRNAITRFHLQGWSAMTQERVRQVAQKASFAKRTS